MITIALYFKFKGSEFETVFIIQRTWINLIQKQSLNARLIRNMEDQCAYQGNGSVTAIRIVSMGLTKIQLTFQTVL